jgi:hypothetical protein
MVGPGRVERPTSRLSGVRSNHLSYEPETYCPWMDKLVSGSLRQSIAKPGRIRPGFSTEGRETKTAAGRHYVLRDVWDWP